jgi:four helix bundle protein
MGCELDYYLLLARELDYLDEPAGRPLATEIMEIRRMLGSFIQKLKA